MRWGPSVLRWGSHVLRWGSHVWTKSGGNATLFKKEKLGPHAAVKTEAPQRCVETKRCFPDPLCINDKLGPRPAVKKK